MKLKYPILSEKGIEYDGMFYFVANNYPWIISMDIVSRKIFFIASFPKEYGDIVGQYIVGGCYKEKLIFIPRLGTKIIEYDLHTKIFWSMEIGEMGIHFERFMGGHHIRFRSTIQKDKFLWILPTSCHHILRYDMETRKLDDYTDWYDELLTEFNWKEVSLFGFGKIHKDNIILPCCQTNAVVLFNIYNGKSILLRIGELKNVFTAIEFWHDRLWLLDNRNRDIIEWNYEHSVILNHHKFPSKVKLDSKFSEYKGYEDFLIGNLQLFGDRLVAIASSGNYFFQITDDGLIDVEYLKISGESYLHGNVLSNGFLMSLSQNGYKSIWLDDKNNIEITNLILAANPKDTNCWMINEDKYIHLDEYISEILGETIK